MGKNSSISPLNAITHTKCQAYTMDATQVFSECCPILEGIGPWAATIQPSPGAKESHVSMCHLNVTAGQIFICESHTTTLCKIMIVLGGDATFCRLKVFMFWAQDQRDVSSLNKIGKTPSIYPGNGKSHTK